MAQRLTGKNARSKKAQALRLLSAGANQIETAQQVDVDVRTIRRWQRDPEFARLVVDMAGDSIKEKLPDILKVLCDEAAKGSHQHIKLLLEHIRFIEQMKQHAIQGQISFVWG